MTEQIRAVFEIDYQQLVIWIAVLAAAFWAVKTLFGKILDWLGIETKWDREKREQREAIQHVADAMDEIKMTVQAQSEHGRKLDEITAMQIRHDLVESCETAIHSGEIPSQVRCSSPSRTCIMFTTIRRTWGKTPMYRIWSTACDPSRSHATQGATRSRKERRKMLNDLIYNVLMALIVAVAGVIARYLVPYLRTKRAAVSAEFRRTKWGWAADIVDAVVRAVEQTVSDGIHGEAKKQIAVDYIRKLLRQTGVDLTDEQLDALVEAAVQALNAETIKVETPIVSTDGMGTSTEDK